MGKIDLGSVIGERGLRGIQGERGLQGIQGIQGEKGTIDVASDSIVGGVKSGNEITVDKSGNMRIKTTRYDSLNILESNVEELEGKMKGTSLIMTDIQESIEQHKKDNILSDEGVHGFRLTEGTMQVWQNNEWKDISVGTGVAPSNVANLRVKVENGKITIRWEDPKDTELDGQLITTWKGTKLILKSGGYPENIKDGILLLDSRERNKYSNQGFVVSGLANGQEYYFQLFPYSDKGAVNESPKNQFSGTPEAYKYMTAIIDLDNDAPDLCVEYSDDAKELKQGIKDWDIFFGHKPCLFNGGEVIGYLNREDFTLYADGTEADITSGNAGDVMIEFPRRGVSIMTIDNRLYISMTDNPNDPDFTYYAHQRLSDQKQNFYIGVYKAYVLSNKLRSLSGKPPTTNSTLGTFRTQAQANGIGYDEVGFYQLIYRQCMYILKYKSLDSQTTVGKGYVAGSSVQSTGLTNSLGMDYGTDSVTSRVKLFGIEDFWGNLNEWVEGFRTDASRNMMTASSNFNNDGTNYIITETNLTANLSGYMSSVLGTTTTGFLPSVVKGSSTTYYCDYVALSANSYMAYGGIYNASLGAGIFSVTINSTSYNSTTGARLMYL